MRSAGMRPASSSASTSRGSAPLPDMPEPASPPPPPTEPWIALAFDFGRRRIGLASADSLTRSARPIGTLQYSHALEWSEIERHIRELRPRQLVVGVPLNADGSPGALTQAAQSFARELERRFKIPVATVDERWSSLEAAER